MRTARSSLIVISLVVSLLFIFTLPARAQETSTPATGNVSTNANLRSGPGTTYSIAGSAKAGTTLKIVGCNTACDWFQLDNGKWIAAFLVTGINKADLERVVSPTTTPAPTSTTPAASAPVTATTSTTSTTQPVAAETPAATPNAVAAATGLTNDEVRQLWQEPDFSQVMTCGHFEYKLTDLRRKKSMWLYSREYVAQGEWLLVFIEVRNISPGTAYFGEGSPRLVVMTEDGQKAVATGNSKASSYASWMFQHGRFYEDINPGKVLGIVEAYDIPLEPNFMLGFRMNECGNDVLSLGYWYDVKAPDPK